MTNPSSTAEAGMEPESNWYDEAFEDDSVGAVIDYPRVVRPTADQIAHILGRNTKVRLSRVATRFEDDSVSQTFMIELTESQFEMIYDQMEALPDDEDSDDK